ncbi:molybdopterin-guanine dinucleotide biosynthesis protein [Arcobacter nitrofigilis DSM 7299]|uniref:Probable molybdenum cofactor guanylyltransferase n=1 Tax=Arcobacter nitrofigilis (strain ATCC 33309 / DSM 7299 / CCUG 15893 / LMG 7604 / NCTC 12251 / CI) TaxID=572480 RepID=D5V506_ARCNC|nr:molybdenum cofactor guanylyltransferase MobA [Arcobacter nitrofigilis]ADG91968.1 molybdopterin-guanine dinucleotide biosynthesis protein [Arcobacter nitrofigilis DSM 7299]
MIKPHFDIPCVILCGGRSSRMGEDKSLLPFSNYNTLTQYQFDRLKTHFKNIYLSSKTNKFDFLKSDENIIFDNIEDESSPLIALKSIFETIKSDKVFILTVDTPFVKIETIAKLINESLNSSTIAITSREHNLCGVYERSCLKIINQMLKENNHKIGFLLKRIELKKIEFFDENEFLNLNKKEDYQKALSLI